MKLLAVECCLVLMCIVVGNVASLDNDLAKTPPMGWLSSGPLFHCKVDCDTYPNTCISEQLYKAQADAMVVGGFRAAGYQYINIDDCWALKERDANKSLVADPKRFPGGIKNLATYVHRKRLKLGIYGDVGVKTCSGYPGSKFSMEQDARLFSSWAVDAVKMDGCNSATSDFPYAYPYMEYYLNKTRRPILFACGWPAYITPPEHNDYADIANSCNTWRNVGHIQDPWASVKDIIEFTGKNYDDFQAVAGPGNFNDPDRLVIGNPGLSPNEEKVQMAMWCIMAAPLFISADLRNIGSDSKSLLLNKGAIAINQDPMGTMARRVWKPAHSQLQAWTRPVLPQGSYAVAILNFGTAGYSSYVNVTLATLGVKGSRFRLTEVFSDQIVGNYTGSGILCRELNGSSVFFGKFTKIP